MNPILIEFILGAVAKYGPGVIEDIRNIFKSAGTNDELLTALDSVQPPEIAMAPPPEPPAAA